MMDFCNGGLQALKNKKSYHSVINEHRLKVIYNEQALKVETFYK